jgi:hypothetical protein
MYNDICELFDIIEDILPGACDGCFTCMVEADDIQLDDDFKSILDDSYRSNFGIGDFSSQVDCWYINLQEIDELMMADIIYVKEKNKLYIFFVATNDVNRCINKTLRYIDSHTISKNHNYKYWIGTWPCDKDKIDGDSSKKAEDYLDFISDVGYNIYTLLGDKKYDVNELFRNHISRDMILLPYSEKTFKAIREKVIETYNDMKNK